MQNKFLKKSLAVAVGCSYLTAAAVHADNARVEEVIVTAQKHEENIQTVPLAISALTADDLQVRGITSFEGVAKSSPSIAMTPYPTSSTLLILYMRGQGVADANQITADGSVGLYEDGFYISRPQAATFDLADVERVEVMRGPQGTLYGRNTTGGAVALIGKQPTGEFGFKQDLTFGSLDQFRSLTTVNLPKWNELSSKVVMLKSSIDGSVKNTGSSHDFGEQQQLAGRLTLHWTPITDFTADYFLEKGNLDSTPIYYQNAALSGTQVQIPSFYPAAGLHNYYADGGKPQRKTYRDFDLDLSKSNFEGHGLTLAYDVNDHFTIKSLTGYRKLNWNAYGDFGDAFTATIPGLGMVPLVSRVFDDVHSHQFSQEFQFVGDALDSAINYVVGLYYFKEGASHEQDGDNGGAIPLPNGGGFDLFHYQSLRYVTSDAKSQAIFGQVTWTPPILDEKLALTAGARYTKDDRSATRDYYNGNADDPIYEVDAKNSLSYKRFNPSFTANY
ncbi:MAG TPA: TonB-dependent receptor, partial [Spongiibacteraceae bacterium]|nr:TonB-dependent receptor [Spongiibacteraceae bacterium]